MIFRKIWDYIWRKKSDRLTDLKRSLVREVLPQRDIPKQRRKKMEWLMQGQNLAIVLAAVMLADKIVKLTPTKYDDAIVDIIKGIIGRMKKD